MVALKAHNCRIYVQKRVRLKFAMSNYAYYDSTKSSHLDKQSPVSALEEDF